MMRTLIRSIAILVALFVLGGRIAAQPSVRSDIAGQPGSPLRLGFGARGIGMGNSLIALRVGEISGYYNPALVPFQSSRLGMASFGLLSLDRRLNFLSYGQDLKPLAGIFLGIINAGVSNIDGRDVDGRQTKVYSTSENAFFISFGNRFSNRVSAGISSKILYYHLFEGINSTTVGFDFGLLYSISDQWSIGAVLQDVNAKYKWDTSKLYGQKGNTTTENFPLRRRIGLSFRPSYYEASLTAEFEWIGSTVMSRFGVEISPLELLTIRAGVDQIDFDGNLIAKPSFGFSLKPDFSFLSSYIHYAYVLEPYSPSNMHIIAISVKIE